MSRRLDFRIGDKYDGKKVVHFLRGEAQLSARLVTKLKRTEGGICLNGVQTRTIDILRTGDLVSLNIPAEGRAAEVLPYELEILYEDEDVLVVNKPPNLPIHPSRKYRGNTLANAVAWYLQKKGREPSAFRAVGRLDKGTSGLVVCALNRYAAAILAGKTEKSYLAIVHGDFEGKGIIDLPIFRPDPLKTLRTCGPEGERAITKWEALGRREGLSHLRIKLETGRTHQIRVHFSHLGSPLYGDDMYGAPKTVTQHHFLHCEKAEFILPSTGQKIKVKAPMPPEMKELADYITGG